MQLCQTCICDLSSDVNNTPTINSQNVKYSERIDMGNTLEYNVKSYQVKTTIVNCTNA